MSISMLLRSLGVLDGVPLPGPAIALLDALDASDTPPALQLPAGGHATTNAPIPLALGAVIRTGTRLEWSVDASVVGHILTLTLPDDPSSTLVADVLGATASVADTSGRLSLDGATPLTAMVRGKLAVRLEATGARIVIAELDMIPSSTAVSLPGGFRMILPASFTVVDDIADLGEVQLVLPDSVPLLGGLVVTTSLPGTPGVHSRPALGQANEARVSGTLTFQLPAGFTLADFVPTFADIALTTPAGATPYGADGPRIRESVTLRASIARPPDRPSDLTVSVSAESDGDSGLIEGQGESRDEIGLGVLIAIGPAVVAHSGSTGPAGLRGLLNASRALGHRLATNGGYTLHAVTLEASRADGKLALKVDASAQIQFRDIDLGLASISMDPERPLRVRWRGIAATIDRKSLPSDGNSADAVDIDFRPARADVIDPGGWQVDSPSIPGGMLQVVGTRSGSGSVWIEVDLRFMMDLGPVKVSGATVRATWDRDSAPTFEIRGFEARIEVPGVATGGGRLQLDSRVTEGIELALWGVLIPLRVGGFLLFSMKIAGDVTMFSFDMGVDLPVAVPVGPTGLGLYSVLGTFGSNAALPPLDATDPLASLRQQDPTSELKVSPGDVTIRVGVVVGTMPDLGFVFNAIGVLGLTVPDFALRVGANAHLLTSARDGQDKPIRGASETDDLSLLGGLSSSPPPPGEPSQVGFVDVGLEGKYHIDYVVEARIPVSGRFAADRWFIHAGSDGSASPSRPPGPLQATVFPGFEPLRTGGWAFLMVASDGLANVAGSEISPRGFSVALGVGFTKTFGAVGILWAQVTTSLVAAIGTSPTVVWAKGRLAGTVGIGPFRLGVDALLVVQFGPGHDRLDFHMRICAFVDLWFTTLEGCIELGVLDTAASPIVPGEDDWPWPAVVLADGLGRILPEKSGTTIPPRRVGGDDQDGHAVPVSWHDTPTVWADAIPLLTFPVAPVQTSPTPENGSINDGMSGAGMTRFRWTLTALELHSVGRDGTDAPAAVDLQTSAWQPAAGVPADVGAISTSRQLALLTRHRWLTRVHAGPAIDDAPDESLRGVSGLCTLAFRAGPGWAYGVDAVRLQVPRDEWHAPRRADILALSPVRSFTRGVGFRLAEVVSDGAASADESRTAVYWASGPVEYSDPLHVQDEIFRGALRARSPKSVSGNDDAQMSAYTVKLDEPVRSGDLLVRLHPQGPYQDQPSEVERQLRARLKFTVNDESARPSSRRPGDSTRYEVLALDDGACVISVTLPNGTTAIEWTVRWSWTVDVLGLHAMSIADAVAADAAEADRKASVAADEAAAHPDADPTTQRTMLEPDMSYRLSVSLQWERWTDEGGGGTIKEPGSTRTATWFFRTAGSDQGRTPQEHPSLFSTTPKMLAIDRFQPEYLERYLESYSIADHEQFVFTTEHPSAQFSAPHLATLAAQYKRDICLLLKRSDRVQRPKWNTLKGVSRLTTAEFGCPVPPSGVIFEWRNRLKPSTPYELWVALPPQRSEPDERSPKLRGITFVTSAFSGPEELVGSLGFTRSSKETKVAAARATGHLRVAATASGTDEHSTLAHPSLSEGSICTDDAFESAMTALDLPPVHADQANRSSLLWEKAGDMWRFRGVLIESAEPFARLGGARMDITDCEFDGERLTIHRRDHSGTRCLWALAEPRLLDEAKRLRIRVLDSREPFWMRLTVPHEPGFALTPIVGRGVSNDR